MHKKHILTSGRNIDETGKALIMVHGRGSSAESILSVARHLDVQDFTLVAPSATNNTWYPYSFLEEPARNEPWLSSALSILEDLVQDLAKTITRKNIFILGFSQGACLSLEFITRHADQFGGCIAFTGGLIGDKIYFENYSGDFKSTPVFIGSSDPDPHVPVQRVHDTAQLLKQMNASVTEKVYVRMGHTINQDELDHANRILAGK